MNEKQLTLNDAFQVWWYITWRMILVVVGVGIVLQVLGRVGGEVVSNIVPFVSIIVSILAQVYFIRMALNRSYKGFRISVVEQGTPTPLP